MPTTEEAFEWVKQNAPEEIAQALEVTTIREENKRLAGEVAELKPKAQAFDASERRPQIEAALKDAKVDTKQFRKSDWETVQAKLAEGDITPERVSELAAQYDDWPRLTNETPRNQPPAAAIANQATGGGTPTSGGDKDAAFYADLDAVPDGDKAGIAAVIQKHGRAPAEP